MSSELHNLTLVTLKTLTGEQTGGPTSIMHICTTDHAIPRHLLLPEAKQIALTEDDKAFLRSKGVYSFLSDAAMDCLIRAYFHHVHPIMPVLEADKLLEHYRSKRLHEYNLILLWSLCSISCNVSKFIFSPSFNTVAKCETQYLPAEICEAEGFTSRKTMKSEMYSRAAVSDILLTYSSPM